MQEEFDDGGILEEVDENEDADGENDVANNFDMELDASKEITDNSAEEKEDDTSEEFAGIPGGINKIDDNSAEPLEEVRIVSLSLYVYF